MRILVSGATGFIGSALVPALQAAGHQISRLVRRQAAAGDIQWDPAGGLDPSAVAGFDAAVHLAGENISGRWTVAKKQRIRDSRIQGTRTLATALASAQPRPRVLVSASAIGFYGNRGDDVLDESASPGSDFLAEVANEWEAAADPARQADLRVAHLRFGVVLSPRGGALKQMLPTFRLGLGGRVGSGRQWWSWIALDDVVAAIQHALATESLRGPVNTVSPQPLTNADFTRVLGEVLRRPTVLPMPGFAVKLVFGEMGEALLLASQRVEPAALKASGFQWRYPELRQALAAMLRR